MEVIVRSQSERNLLSNVCQRDLKTFTLKISVRIEFFEVLDQDRIVLAIINDDKVQIHKMRELRLDCFVVQLLYPD